MGAGGVGNQPRVNWSRWLCVEIIVVFFFKKKKFIYLGGCAGS